MLGSASEADDAVQESWIRLERTDVSGVENLRAWLTTVVARVCLNTLRSRQSRREVEMGPRVPEPIVGPEDGTGPEHEALLADSRLVEGFFLSRHTPPFTSVDPGVAADVGLALDHPAPAVPQAAP